MEVRKIAEALNNSSLRCYTKEYLYPKILELIKLSKKNPEYNTIEGAKRFCINQLGMCSWMTEGVTLFIHLLFKKMIDDRLIIYSPVNYKIETIDEDKMRKLFSLIFIVKNGETKQWM